MTQQKYLKLLGIAHKSRKNKRLKELKKQQNECSICRKHIEGKTAHWDHDHVSGQFRAFLCGTCNAGLGFFKDDPSILRRAALYIELHQAAIEVKLESK
jgi:hypothetical protein